MKTCCLTFLAAIVFTIGMRAQSIQPASAVPTFAGTSIGASFHFDRLTQRTTYTTTLKFGPSENPAFTIAYVFTYPGTRMARPSVVDEVITRHLPDESRPEFAINAGGEWTPVAVRQTSHSAMTRTMSIEDFLHQVNAQGVRERIFGSELVFGDLQLRMLRQQTVDRWTQ
ncbi:MAG TPA: hypothetical protein VGY57_03795 [Vicinamibacterales bacterium]|jgi:hypothetical protein|nr:hypothetical protein [Vicinamibacterales bacterium]